MALPTVEEQNARRMGYGVGFERVRRITGYLVGTMEKWNDAKRAEERDRVKHDLTSTSLDSCDCEVKRESA